MKLFNKQTMALLICVVTINVLCLVSVSYAYFAVQVKIDGEVKPMAVTAGKMEIQYLDNKEIKLENAIPGDSVTKEFKVTNTGSLETYYNIKLDISENSFESSDLLVTLKKKSTGSEDYSVVIENKELPVLPGGYILVKQKLVKPESNVIEDSYQLTITFVNKETNQQTNSESGEPIEKGLNLTVEVDSEQNATLVAGY